MSLGKKDIIQNISSKAQISTRSSGLILENFLSIIKTKSKIIKLANFGVFYLRDTPSRIGRNPKTKEEFVIPKRNKLFFKASNTVKSALN
jgi:integration host factor subunit alpha